MTIIARKIKYGFSVIGLPVSAQCSSNTKQLYQRKVAGVASKYITSTIKNDEKIIIEIDWFTEGFHNRPDVENIIKPIQDALKGIVFSYDNQVESITSRKHNIQDIMYFLNEPLSIISPLLNGCDDYIFVRID